MNFQEEVEVEVEGERENFNINTETCDLNIDENILIDIGKELGKTREEIEEVTNSLEESERGSANMKGGQGYSDIFTYEQKVSAILWIYSMYKKGVKARKYIPAGICFLQKHLIMSPIENKEKQEKQEKQVVSLYNKTQNVVDKFVKKSTIFLKKRYGENPIKAFLLILWELLLIYLNYLNAKQTKTVQKAYVEGITRTIIENHTLQPIENLLVIVCKFLYSSKDEMQLQGGRGKKYKITAYSYKRAKKLGVQIKPSSNKKKKIDVYKGTRKIASIGAIGYKDYPTFMKINKTLAKERRRRYKTRHRKDRFIKGSPGYYADQILWSS
jgi:hypothetical protein